MPACLPACLRVRIPLRVTLCVLISSISLEPRYNIYFTLVEHPLYWSVPNPPVGFTQASQVYAQVAHIAHLQDVYFTVQGLK